MTAYTPIYNLPYVEASDLVANYPTVSQELAENVETALGSASKILQVISTTKTDTFSTSITAGASALITGLSATITPSDNTNKILVIANVTGSMPARNGFFIGLDAGGFIAIGDAASNRTRIGGAQYMSSSDSDQGATITLHALHSPATTSAVTYGVRLINSSSSTYTMYCNRTINDTDNVSHWRAASTITVMEVSA